MADRQRKCSWIGVAMAMLLGLSPAFGQAETDALVDGVHASTREYLAKFRDLLAEERKTFEFYGSNGRVRKTRVVESNFIVYELGGEGRAAEYRHVLRVDGKAVEKADLRSEEFFAKLTKLGSSRKELEKLQLESTRFDEGMRINGFTLFQAVALSQKVRGVMAFRQSTDGGPMIRLDYEQTGESPYITVNRGSTSGEEAVVSFEIDDNSREAFNGRLRGSLWVDAESKRVVHEVRELTVRPAGFVRAVLISRVVLEYQPSEFGINTPAKITHEFFTLIRKQQRSKLDVRAVFEYTRFSRPDVDVKAEEPRTR
ncbi:MAG: hypothetical protein KF831_00165 [Acidobacteria bacterium]|nr:hypothetical protein [Acidobacteriota bacterium]